MCISKHSLQPATGLTAIWIQLNGHARRDELPFEQDLECHLKWKWMSIWSELNRHLNWTELPCDLIVIWTEMNCNLDWTELKLTWIELPCELNWTATRTVLNCHLDWILWKLNWHRKLNWTSSASECTAIWTQLNCYARWVELPFERNLKRHLKRN